MINQAVILSAGLGTRMKNLTKLQPKPMLVYQGKPLIEHQIIWLKKWGISRFYINLFYLPSYIIDYLGNGSSLGVEIIYNIEETLLGTGGAYVAFKPYLNGNFIAVNCDVIVDLDLTKMVQFHEERNNPATMAILMKAREEYSPIMVNNKTVTDIAGRMGGSGEQGIFTGLHIISNVVFNYLPRGASSVISSFYLPLLNEGKNISAYTDINEWIDLGTEKLFRKYLKE